MPESANAMEALKLVSDWSKWLVTIETLAIALLGSLFTSSKIEIPKLAKKLGTAALVCFVISIVAAAMLLLTLPEIAQSLQSDVNIWMTKDSVAYSILRLNTQGFAVIESYFFGLGIVLASGVVVTMIWKPHKGVGP